jgi:hypothetical protein
MVLALPNTDSRMFYGDRFLDVTSCLIEIANANNPKICELERLKDELSKINQKGWAGIFKNPVYTAKQNEIEEFNRALNSRAYEMARGKYKKDEADIYRPYPDDYGFSLEIDHSRIQGLKGVLRDSPEILEFSPLIETELEIEFYKHREDPLKKLKKAIQNVRINKMHSKNFHTVIFSSPEKVFDSNGDTSKTGSVTSFSTLVEYPQKSPGLLNARMKYCIAGDGSRITLPKEETEEIGKLVDLVTTSLQESAR